MFIKSWKTNYSIACMTISVLLFACSGSQNKDKGAYKKTDTKKDNIKEASDAHTSQNSLDWVGTYTGVIPCADCEGIETKITLKDNRNYQKFSVYLGKDSRAFSEAGQFEWNERGSRIGLMPKDGEPSEYKVGEGYLQMLSRQGEVITGELADRYILKKNLRNDRIEDKTWFLLEFLGREIDNEGTRKAARIELHSVSGHISGYNGCNSVTGEYSLLDNNRIQFGTIASTRMACPEKVMQQAMKFNDVLAKADNYKIEDNELTLWKGKMAVLARFELE